jgi:uncharacterized membrane protein YphA (DoxX/SURF4 family)
VSWRDRLASPWLTIRVQIALGVIFVAAALPKIGDPPSFAHMLYNYRIVPGGLLNLFALALPWFELLLGVALVLGLWKRTAALLVGALLFAFVLGLGLNVLRGNPIDCGCFNVWAADKSIEERLFDMRMVVVRDLGMLVLVAQVLWATHDEPEASRLF